MIKTRKPVDGYLIKQYFPGSSEPKVTNKVVIFDDGFQCVRRDVTSRMLLWVYKPDGAYGVDEAVLTHMDENGITEAHYWDKDNNKLLVASIFTIREKGIPKTLNGRAQRHLLMRYWVESDERYDFPRVRPDSTAVVLK